MMTHTLNANRRRYTNNKVNLWSEASLVYIAGFRPECVKKENALGAVIKEQHYSQIPSLYLSLHAELGGGG